MRALCSRVRPPLHRSISSMPPRAIDSGIEVIATFWTRPSRTWGAIGSLGSESRISRGCSPPGPNRIGTEPKPFGMTRATGNLPARTAASAVAAVRGAGFSVLFVDSTCVATFNPASERSASRKRRELSD